MIGALNYNYNINVILNLKDDEHLAIGWNGSLRPADSEPYFANLTKKAVLSAAKQFFEEIAKIEDPLRSGSVSLKPIRKDARKFARVIKRLYPEEYRAETCRLIKDFARFPEITEIFLALKQGIAPQAVDAGISGTYFLFNRKKTPWAVFKPLEQEPGQIENPKGNTAISVGALKSGTFYQRERAAYLIDPDHFSHVPKTVVARFPHLYFTAAKTDSLMKGSLQKFIPAASQAYRLSSLDVVSTQEIHRLAILDIRLLNHDRHFGNVLVDSANRLRPIDHGFTFPEKATAIYFEWLTLKQANVPFDSTTLAYIKKLDPERDIQVILKKIPSFSKESLNRFRQATYLLKMGAEMGMTAWEIGSLMTGRLDPTIFFEGILFNPSLETESAIRSHLKPILENYIGRDSK